MSAGRRRRRPRWSQPPIPKQGAPSDSCTPPDLSTVPKAQNILLHNFELDAAARKRAVRHIGDDNALHHFFRKLDHGAAITLGVLGSSVAQNGGCLDQPGRRCMEHNGRHQKCRTFYRFGTDVCSCTSKGFAVRLLEAINATWPHSNHRLRNAAVDATPAQSFLPCLFTHLPKALDLVILEFGSLALHLQLRAAEQIVRELRMLPSAPVIAFISVRGMCQRASRNTRQTVGSWAVRDAWLPSLARQGRRRRLPPPPPPPSTLWEYVPINETTRWSQAEDFFERLCNTYGSACLSYYHAVRQPMEARAPGFLLHDTSNDCLHPSGGRFGTAYLVDIFVHWLRSSLTRVRSRLIIPQRAKQLLPLPLLPWPSLNRTRAARCYAFAEQSAARSPFGALAPVLWRSAASSCNATTAAGMRETAATAEERAGPCAWLKAGAQRACPVTATDNNIPDGWVYCHRSLKSSTRAPRKVSPGVMALVPGAILEAEIDTRLAGMGRRNPNARLKVVLEYLTSYEGMGVASVSCTASCRCSVQTIDAHRAGQLRNESVFSSHEFDVLGAHSSCTLRVSLLHASSSSGHQFKLRSVSVKS